MKNEKIITSNDVLDVATQYHVDQYDVLECFLCDLLNVSPDKLYEILENHKEGK